MEDKYLIKPEDELIRRVLNKPDFYKDGQPTSAAFKTKPGEDGLSVNILNLTTKEDSVIDKERFVLALFKASVVLELGFECEHKPVEGNYSHAIIKGDTRKVAKKIATSCIIDKI